MGIMKKYIYLTIILLLTACEQKSKPNITINPNLSLPIKCMRLNIIEDELTDKLKELYPFDNKCNLTLTLSSKKDIVCNSPQNVMLKSSGKFPKSYLRLKLRRGMEVEYSYYIDLYSNVDEDDVEEAFSSLKKDLIEISKL
jgi:hypothetical protein